MLSGENPPPVTARVTHAPAQNSPTTCIHQNPPISTSHSLKEQGVVKHTQTQEKRNQARGGHAPHTAPQHRRSKRIPDQKTSANTAGRCVSSRRRWKSTDLAFKMRKMKDKVKLHRRHAGTALLHRAPHAQASCQNKTT